MYSLDNFSKIKAVHVMRVPVIIDSTETIEQVVSRFMRDNISSLVVLDEQGRVIGVITRNDILRLVFASIDS